MLGALKGEEKQKNRVPPAMQEHSVVVYIVYADMLYADVCR